MATEKLPTLQGWGRLPGPGSELRSENLERITEGAVLSRGLGRSYGDSSLPPPSHPLAVNTTLADRVLAFDKASGLLRAEAGLSLVALNKIFLNRGFFPPVTPGTQFVTLGGMVAADVHGKNHHVEGTFGRHVQALKLRLADGNIVTCSREQLPELFHATVGGMGLTGHILEVSFTMRPIPSPWIYQETERIPNLDTFLHRLKESASQWPMTMGWVDCLKRGPDMGRGILFCGRWATPEEAPSKPPSAPKSIPVPFELPSWLLTPWTIRVFNFALYHKHGRTKTEAVVSPWSFFYPLDTFLHWNRAYGPRGFTQHQAVLPTDQGFEGVREFLELLTRLGGASFLCVIKDCGPEGEGLLSFPRPGISIALDLPVRANTQEMVDELNEMVIRLGGRIYLAKDAFTRPEHFRAMEPRLDDFQAIRQKWDPQGHLRSAQSIRLLGDTP